MKIYNGYCGLGGNRKLWGNDHQITAVDNDPEVARLYQENFPNDTVIVGDAHQYLLDHFQEFDFIWTSPKCQSHTRLNTASFPKGSKDYCYPDMALYAEVIFLKHWFKGKYIIENVKPYYTPLIAAQELDRHLFWANFKIGINEIIKKKESHETAQIPYLEKLFGFDLSESSLKNKRQVLRNCVHPETGLYILNCARNIITKSNIHQIGLFE